MYLHLNKHTFILVPVVLLMLLVICSALGGCGSSSSDQTLTKKEFTTRAEHICASARTTVSTTAILYKRKDPSIEEVDLVTKVAVPSIEDEIRRIKALGTPSEGGSEARTFVSAFESGLEDTKKDPKAVLVTKTNPFVKGKAAAAAYGLEICSTFP